MPFHEAYYDTLPVYRLKELVEKFQLSMPKGSKPTRANYLNLLAEHTERRAAERRAQRVAVAALEAQLAADALLDS